MSRDRARRAPTTRTKPRSPAGEPAARESALLEAQRLVHGDRQAAYGHPYDDYLRTSRMWEGLLGLPEGFIGPRKAALMMALVKASREVNRPKRDNRVDGAGYFECVDLIAEREAELAAVHITPAQARAFVRRLKAEG